MPNRTLTRSGMLRMLAVFAGASLTAGSPMDERTYVMFHDGTEPPFSSPLIAEHRAGIYHCANCQLALFSSKAKYDSGDGWPSFTAPLPNAVATKPDYQLAQERTEVHCKRCAVHLGHVFNDGPPPAGLRYCIDGVALNFVPSRTTLPSTQPSV